MKPRTYTVEYELNPNGCPSVQAGADAFATAVSIDAEFDQPRNQILISGNRKGLLALAGWLIALADNESIVDHQHFDNEVDSGFFKSDVDCELIIERLGK